MKPKKILFDYMQEQGYIVLIHEEKGYAVPVYKVAAQNNNYNYDCKSVYVPLGINRHLRELILKTLKE